MMTSIKHNRNIMSYRMYDGNNEDKDVDIVNSLIMYGTIEPINDFRQQINLPSEVASTQMRKSTEFRLKSKTGIKSQLNNRK